MKAPSSRIKTNFCIEIFTKPEYKNFHFDFLKIKLKAVFEPFQLNPYLDFSKEN